MYYKFTGLKDENGDLLDSFYDHPDCEDFYDDDEDDYVFPSDYEPYEFLKLRLGDVIFRSTTFTRRTRGVLFFAALHSSYKRVYGLSENEFEPAEVKKLEEFL